MKKLLSLIDGWVGSVAIIAIIICLCTGLYFQKTSYDASELKYKQELINQFHLNQKLVGENVELKLKINEAERIMFNNQQIMRLLYERLRQYEDLPPLPGPDGKQRYDA